CAVRRNAAVPILAGLLLAAGCRSAKPVVVIGSKEFTEQIVLGELAARMIESRLPVRVVRQFNLGGTFICYNALRRGDLDVYPEYTGTALAAILKRHRPEGGAPAVFRIVRRDLAPRGVRVLSPLGFNNTYALMMRG